MNRPGRLNYYLARRRQRLALALARSIGGFSSGLLAPLLGCWASLAVAAAVYVASLAAAHRLFDKLRPRERYTVGLIPMLPSIFLGFVVAAVSS